MLIEAGHGLVGDGVPFVDLTGVFAAEERTLYIDNCCHFNELGYEILIAEMATHIDRAD